MEYQFGPEVLPGGGDTAVKIYPDTAICMGPLAKADVRSMVASLRGRRWLEG